MSAYRRSKYSFGDYPTAGGSSSSAYHSALAATSSAASLTRTNYSAPISSLVVNGSMAPTSSSCISSMINTRPSMNRYTSSYSASKLTSTLTSASGAGRPTSSSSIYTSRSPRLQSYLRETSESKPVKSSYSRPSRYDLESSRSRSYSHSGLYDQGSSYRSRSSSVRDTSPYDAERDRDLVMSMRSQSAMSGRAASRDRTTYTSSILDDPMISTYSRSLTSDPLMTSSVLGSSTTNTVGGGSGSSAALGASTSKKYGSDEWSEATWLNNLRISAGMEPIPMPTSSASNSKSLAYEAVSTLPRMLRSNSSTDLTLEALKMSQGLGSSAGGSKTGLNTRARHQTLAYGVSASDLNLRNSDLATAAAGFSSTILRNGSDNDILVARVPSREGEVYDVRGFESDMSAAIMNARSRRHSMDNEIIELHPPLVTFGSIDYDGDLPAVGPTVQNPPPPPAPYDHKNLVVVNRNDLESILVSKGTSPAQNMLHKQHPQQQRPPSSASMMGNHGYRVPSSSTDNATTSDTTLVTRSSNNNVVTSSSVATSSSNHVGSASMDRPPSATDRSQNGEIDYRKLWEQAQLDNSRLRDDLARTRDELSAAKKKLETMVQTPSTTSGLTDTEKKEKMALEKKLSEMEEELKLLALSENLTDQQLEHLKNDNQRLRDENGALIRVISKLSK